MQQPGSDGEIVFRTPWFEIVSEHPVGLDQPHYSIRSCDFVVIVGLNPQGQLLLVRQFRHAVRKFTLELRPRSGWPRDPRIRARRAWNVCFTKGACVRCWPIPTCWPAALGPRYSRRWHAINSRFDRLPLEKDLDNACGF